MPCNHNRSQRKSWLAWSLAAACGLSSVAAYADTPAPAPVEQTAKPVPSVTSSVEMTDPAATARATIEKGLAYLKLQQQGDGGWQKSEREPVGITALVLRAFVNQPGYTSTNDPARKGFERLFAYQLEDGGIYKNLLASYNTAIALSTMTAANDPSMNDRIDRATVYLKRLQWTTDTLTAENDKITGESDTWYGGWGYNGGKRGTGRPDMSNSQFAIEALHDAGVKSDDPAMQAALKFVTSVQNNSETNDQPWAGNDGGLIYGPAVDRAGESDAGTFTDADGKRRIRSMGTMTYAGLKSFIYAGLTKDDPRVRAAWKWINHNWTLDENPGRGFAGESEKRNGLFYYYHTVARALHAYGEPTLTDPNGKAIDWRVELIKRLSSIQSADGSWTGEKAEMENNSVLVTSYCVLTLQEALKDLADHPAK